MEKARRASMLAGPFLRDQTSEQIAPLDVYVELLASVDCFLADSSASPSLRESLN